MPTPMVTPIVIFSPRLRRDFPAPSASVVEVEMGPDLVIDEELPDNAVDVASPEDWDVRVEAAVKLPGTTVRNISYMFRAEKIRDLSLAVRAYDEQKSPTASACRLP